MFENLFPTGVEVVSAAADAAPGPLYPEEAVAVERAVARRRRDFELGRSCARAALARLGIGPTAIPVRADRAPVWPDGVVGAITHCDGLAAAAVARARDFAGLGLDAEVADPIEDKLARLICTPAERKRLAGLPPLGGTDWVKLAFSAKESVHKAIAPSSGVMLGFRDVELDIEPSSARFGVRLVATPDPRLPDFARLEGRYAVTDGFVLTTVLMRHDDRLAPDELPKREP